MTPIHGALRGTRLLYSIETFGKINFKRILFLSFQMIKNLANCFKKTLKQKLSK